MNVCPLDVLARTPDFDSIAASLELRGWEWDFLHVVDGEATLGDVVRHMGIDMELAVDFVHESMHRGLLAIATMTLQAYRSRGPSQTAIASGPRTLYLGTAAAPQPSHETYAPPAVAPLAAATVMGAVAAAVPMVEHAAQPVVAPVATTPSTISFSSDAFDWTEPEEHEEHEEAAPVAHAESPHVEAVHAEPIAEAHAEPLAEAPATDHGAVHWDDRFGVEHADGPFAATPAHEEPTVLPHVEAPHVEAPESVANVPDPFSRAFVVDDPFATAPHHETAIDHGNAFDHAPSVEAEHQTIATASPFADLMQAHEDESVVPFAPMHDVAPIVDHHPDPMEETVAEHGVHDPFAAPEPAGAATPILVAEAPVDAAAPQPVVEPTNGKSAHPEAALNGRAVIEPSRRDAAPGSISFSFSSDDPLDVEEAPEPPRTPAHIPDPVYMPSDVVYHDERVAEAAKDSAATSATHSTFYEREAIDTDASRELETKTKNWKESLSWREQQELNEAEETGKPKSGVIGSLLRALGVR